MHREISRRPPNCSDGSGRSWDGAERALEAERRVTGNRSQAKWFQPDKPSTGSLLRVKTTSDWVICPISVTGTSTFLPVRQGRERDHRPVVRNLRLLLRRGSRGRVRGIVRALWYRL